MSKKRGGEEGGGDSWLNTYADMVTLLLTFFAVLLSMSNTDESKFNAFIRSFSNLPQEVIEEIVGSIGEDAEGDITVINGFDKLFDNLKEYIDSQGMGESINISRTKDIIYIRFNSALFFEPDKYVLRPDSIPTLEFVADGLLATQDQIKMVNVVGHTATVDQGTYWMLSGERAAAVATYFNYTKGFSSKKLLVMGYGNQYPVAQNDTEEGRKKNRRVELIIISNESEASYNVYDHLEGLYNEAEYPTSGDVDDVYLPDTDPGTAPPDSGVEPDVSPYNE